MKSFPLFLNVEKSSIVIFGGGEQAAQKLRLVLKTEGAITVVSPEIVEEIAAHVASGRVAHIPQVTSDTALRKAALTFIATGCAGADASIAAVARGLGVLVNVVDRPELCDVTTPAIVDRDPVVVAIGTEGTAPVLSRQIKSRIEEMLEPELGKLATLAGNLRPRVAARIAPARRRFFWEWFFTTPRQLFATGRTEEAEEVIESALAAGPAESHQAGFVSLVGAGPGAADMITLRAVQRLQTADVIFYDRLVDPGVLELARRDAERINVGKTPGGASWKQSDIDDAIVTAALGGKRVVRLKSGDPGIFGRATEEMAALDAHGIPWEIVAGVTAASAAAADAHLSLTEREKIRSVVLTTGHVADGSTTPDWAAHAHPGALIAIYMGVAKADEIERSLISHGAPLGLPVEIVENAGRPYMRRVGTKLGSLAASIRAERIRNPAILFVRWPEDVPRSAVIPLAKNRRTDPDMRRAESDRFLEVAAHAH